MKAEDRRVLILECAKELFSRRGYHKTQIADIILKAKIARGTIYQYFKNKDDIFITLLEEYFDTWRAVVSKRDEGIDLAEITAVDFFRLRIQSTLKFFASDRDLCNIVLRVGLGLHAELDEVTKRLEDDIKNIIMKDIELGVGAGNVRPGVNVELTANILAGALHRVSYDYFVSQKNQLEEKDIDSIADEFTYVFAPGIFIGG